MLILKTGLLIYKTNPVPVWTKMTGKGLTRKFQVKSSGHVDPAKKEIQQQAS
jgi:hypothetical protein